MEGVERTKYGFASKKTTRIFFYIFPCCISNKSKSKLFKGKWLKIEKSVEPELLIWENFGVTGISRFFRLMLYIVFVILMLVLCFYIISLLETASNEA